VWTFNSLIDIKFDKKSIPKEALSFFEKYAVDRGKGKFFLNVDNARFINHSKNPNTKSLGPSKDNIATKDISPGEEITINYSEIDVTGVDFQEIKN